ncbi:MAG: WYL domain-containing transcriptional regulator [Bacteroidales bacterium]|nr:WYL domain-containing transcriptional regulator [Bacteroidales bacterium]
MPLSPPDEHATKLKRAFDLISMLANRAYTLEEICLHANLQPRTAYRLLKSFKACGFIVEKEGTYFRISPQSVFFRRVSDRIYFSENEAITVWKLLQSVHRNRTPEVKALQQKLDRLHDFGILAPSEVDEQMGQNLAIIYQAIKEERIVCIHDYLSTHSQQRERRIVEPFQFLQTNNDVRCYELSSGLCKTFRVSRMGRVELIDLKWSYRERHELVHTDAFGFSSKEQIPVTLRLDQMAAQILIEEYPAAITGLSRLPHEESQDEWIDLSIAVCDYRGIGRFVLGLLDHITIVRSPRFAAYVKQQLSESRVSTADA